MSCVNINLQEVKDLAKELGEHIAITAARIGIWQEANGDDKFPTAKELSVEKKSSKELSQEERDMIVFETGIGFKKFARRIKEVNYDELKAEQESLYEKVDEETITPEETERLSEIESILIRIHEVHQQYKADVKKALHDIKNTDFDGMSEQELLETYWNFKNLDPNSRSASFKPVLKQLGVLMYDKRAKELSKKFDKEFNETNAKKEDLHPKDVLMKAMSHMTEAFPEVQVLSEKFDEAYSAKEIESAGLKRTDAEHSRLNIIRNTASFRR